MRMMRGNLFPLAETLGTDQKHLPTIDPNSRTFCFCSCFTTGKQHDCYNGSCLPLVFYFSQVSQCLGQKVYFDGRNDRVIYTLCRAVAPAKICFRVIWASYPMNCLLSSFCGPLVFDIEPVGHRSWPSRSLEVVV